jgi:hypothetical protein
MNTEELFTIIQGTIWSGSIIGSPEGSISLEGMQPNGLGIIMHNHNGRIWLEITVFDKDMDDGREIEFEIRKVN